MDLINIIYIISIILIMINIVSNSIIKYGVAGEWWNFGLNFIFIFGILILYQLIFKYTGKRISQFYILGMVLLIIAIGSIRLYWNRVSKDTDEKIYTTLEIFANSLSIFLIVLFLLSAGKFANSRQLLYLIIYFIIAILSAFMYNQINPFFDKNNTSKSVFILIFIWLMIIVGTFLTSTHFQFSNLMISIILLVITILYWTSFSVILGYINRNTSSNGSIPSPPPPIPNPNKDYIEVDEDVLKKILANLKDFYAIDNCQSANSDSCNYLFEQLIANPAFDYQKLEMVLASMEKEALKNQNMYLLYQLLQCRLKLKNVSEREIYTFGTFDWYVENNFGNLFQTFIYIVSLIIFVGFIFYNFYNVFWLSPNIISTFGNRNIFFAIFITVIIINLFAEGFLSAPVETHVYNVPNDMKPYIKNSISESPSQRAQIAGRSITTILVLSAILITILNFFIKNNMITLINIAIWSGLIFVFNIYYGFIIPQAMIIALLLQKFIISTPLTIDNTGDLMILIIKAIVLLVILVASLYDTQYRRKTENNEVENTTTANSPVWLLFGIIMVAVVVNILDTFVKGKTDKNGWGLVLAPIGEYILKWSTNKDINLSIKNIV